MDKPTQEDLQKALESTSAQKVEETQTVETVETETTDPLKAELERVKSKKTPQEKARESLYHNAMAAKNLGIDITKDEQLKQVFGIKEESEEVDEDEKPVTRKELEQLLSKQQQAAAVRTAQELASEIADETERELTLYHIQNTIKSTGDAKEDIRLARALTNSVRNTKILEEQMRKPEAKTHSSATSISSTKVENEIVLTPEERTYLATGVVTKEEILLARQGKEIPR